MANVAKKLGVGATSSTGAEVAPVGGRLPKRAWPRHPRLAQGGPIKEDVLLQDNKSAVLLQENHPCSTGEGMEHVHVRFYFATDKIRSKELGATCCPAEELVANCNS